MIEQQWQQYASSCVQPGIHYFLEKFGNDSTHPLAVFKAARLFSPSKVHDIQPTAADIDCLSVIPWLNVLELKEELPTYLAKASDVDSSTNILDWWERNCFELPLWSSAAQKIFLIQPSSAAAERVFSLLNSTSDDHQNNSLEDYVESTIMLQYNNRSCVSSFV